MTRRLALAMVAIASLLVAAVWVPASRLGDQSGTRTDRAPRNVEQESPPPPASVADSGFVAFGDFGGGPGQFDVAHSMGRWSSHHRVDALVTMGDNVYDFGEPQNFKGQLDDPYAALRRSRPFWVSLGNHDAARGNGPKQLAYLGLPALPYERDLPGVRLLFLDANRPDVAQARWLGEALARPGPALRVALFHQPAWSCGPHGSTAAVSQTWAPVFESHRVALVLNGHDHNYQRFESNVGVNYVVSGGGGRQLYPLTNKCPREPRLVSRAMRYHFVGVEVQGNTLNVSVVGTDDAVLDQFTVTR